MKWRLVLVNATLPNSAFYTIQKDDYSVLKYNADHQEEYCKLASNTGLTLGGIGDAYGRWEDEELPNFLNK